MCVRVRWQEKYRGEHYKINTNSFAAYVRCTNVKGELLCIIVNYINNKNITKLAIRFCECVCVCV